MKVRDERKRYTGHESISSSSVPLRRFLKQKLSKGTRDCLVTDILQAFHVLLLCGRRARATRQMQPISWLYGALSNALSHANNPFLAISCRLDHGEPMEDLHSYHHITLMSVGSKFGYMYRTKTDWWDVITNCYNQIRLSIKYIETSETRRYHGVSRGYTDHHYGRGQP